MNQPVKELFDQSAESYARLFKEGRSGANHCFQTRREIARSLAAGFQGSCLDCAVGSGEVAAAVLSGGMFDRATMVDISPKMLDLAQAGLAAVMPGRCEWVNADTFEFLKSSEESHYDFAICAGLIAHTGRAGELLRLLRKVIRPGGAMLLHSTLSDHWGTRIHRRLTARRYFRNHGYWIHYFPLREIQTLAEAAGFTVEKIERFCFGLPFGDKLFPGVNYRLEQLMKGWARRHGSEAIFLLRG